MNEVLPSMEELLSRAYQQGRADEKAKIMNGYKKCVAEIVNTDKFRYEIMYDDGSQEFDDQDELKDWVIALIDKHFFEN